MENGSEYRTLLKAFGIRFDVLVYGNVSPGTLRMRGTGEASQACPQVLKRLSGDEGLPLIPHQLPVLCRVEPFDLPEPLQAPQPL